MKTITSMVIVAVVAVVLIGISQSDAQESRCPQALTPPLNSTAVTCEHRPLLGLACAVQCVRCYTPRPLHRGRGCIVAGRCTCLAKSKEEATTTTRPITTTDELVTDSTTAGSISTTQGFVTEETTRVDATTTEGEAPITTTTVPQETTTEGGAGGEETTPNDNVPFIL